MKVNEQSLKSAKKIDLIINLFFIDAELMDDMHQLTETRRKKLLADKKIIEAELDSREKEK